MKLLRACIVGVFAVLVATASLAAAQSKKPAPPKELLDLNTATVEQLKTLPTVGEVAAKAIVRFREKSGPFRRVEDLLAVPGFTKKRLAKIRPYIIVNSPAEPPQQHL